MNRIKNIFVSLQILKDTKGQDLIEYALMAGFVAVAAGAIMPGVSTNISQIFSKISSSMGQRRQPGFLTLRRHHPFFATKLQTGPGNGSRFCVCAVRSLGIEFVPMPGVPRLRFIGIEPPVALSRLRGGGRY
jgi:pilus assembly protein Flp/PilA